jgi:hypothetical protein
VVVKTEDIREKLPELERWDDGMTLALLYHESARDILNLSLSLALSPLLPSFLFYLLSLLPSLCLSLLPSLSLFLTPPGLLSSLTHGFGE